MFKTILILALFSLLGPFRVFSQQKVIGDGYKLVWADEFNKPGAPAADNWSFEKGLVRNHELQWYQPQNAVCKNGHLIIEARKANIPNPRYKANSNNWQEKPRFIPYTSSSLNTNGHHSWQYGRFMMRGKIDTQSGLWPAFWTLGAKGEWPANGEIDIMEFYRGKLLANIACGTNQPYKALWYSKTRDIAKFKKNWSKKFHIWRMDWDATEISLYVDDILLNRVPLSDLVNRDGTNINPFKQPHYILLNLAIGGDNGGDPAQTLFPKRFEIDYVRVYQKPS